MTGQCPACLAWAMVIHGRATHQRTDVRCVLKKLDGTRRCCSAVQRDHPVKSTPLGHAFVDVGFDAGRGRVLSMSKEGVIYAGAVSSLIRHGVVRSTFANGGRSVVRWCSDHAVSGPNDRKFFSKPLNGKPASVPFFLF